MAIYYTTYKRFNGVDWDIFYFKTNVAQVVGLTEIIEDIHFAIDSLEYVNIVASTSQPNNLSEDDHWWEITEVITDYLPPYVIEVEPLEVFASIDTPAESKLDDIWIKEELL